MPSDHAVPLGDASFDLGASLGVPAMTAHRCLFADGPIDGGAGAVGRMAIELAVLAGATVVATVSGPEKGELARAA
ncbi:MAG: NADPH:quinone reductase, partial [Thermoleophilaceae bacterium]|nr:NADPH:quinone reductase [Thermoleophilaceae bacterium]